MRPSWRLGINNLAGRRGRTALLVAAVTFASALIVAVATAMYSVQTTVEGRILATLGAADARVVHLFNGRFDAALLETVRAWPQVESAIGRYSAAITLVRTDGRVDPDTELPLRLTPLAHGIDSDIEFAMRPIDLARGTTPRRPDEMLIDSYVARRMDWDVGDEAEVQRFGEPLRLRIVGVYNRPTLGAFQRPQVYVTRSTLEEVTERDGLLTDIAIDLRSGTDVEAFCRQHAPEVPEQLALEPAEMVRTGFDRRVYASRVMFILGALFAFLSCSFIIVIGMTTGVTERQRELAIIRCIGATRGQVFLSQMWVGLLVGAAGGAVGIPLGVGLAAILIHVFRELIPAGLQLSWLGIGLAAGGSIGAGLLGAVWPAFEASRVAPLKAFAVRAAPPRARTGWLMAGAAACLLVMQPVLFLPQSEQTRFWLYVTTALPLMQIGYFILAVPAFIVVARTFGPLLSRLLQLPGNLLTQSALAIPVRLGLTAGALMIGVAILVSTWTSTTSVLQDWLGKMTFADGFAFKRDGLTAKERQTIASLPFVEATCPIAYVPLRVMNHHLFGVQGIAPPNVICIGFEPDEFFRVNRVDWVAGTPEQAIPRLRRGEGVLVAEEFLTTKGLTVGDTLELGAGRVVHAYEIVGVVSAAGLDVATQMFGIRNVYNEHAMSCVFADFSVMSERFDNPDIFLMQMNIADSVTDDEAKFAMHERLPGVLFVSGRSIKKAIDEVGAAILAVQTTVAFAALVLACFAVGSVLVANVNSRRYEYGVLRAVGASKAHLAKLVLGEAMLLAGAAAIVGTFFGLHTAAVDVRFYRDLGGIVLQYRVPWTPMLVGWCVLLALTLLAAIPACIGLVRRTPRQLLATGRGGA